MTFRYIGMATFIFIGFTVINRMLEGVMINASEIEILNQLTIFRELRVAGLFSIPVLNLDFLVVGIPHLFKWDYSFFGGNAGLFQYFLYSFTAAASFGMFIIVMGMLYNMLGRVRG